MTDDMLSKTQENPEDTITLVECCTCGFHFDASQQEWDSKTCPDCGSPNSLGVARVHKDSRSLCWITPRKPADDELPHQWIICRDYVEAAGSLDRDTLRSNLGVSELMPKINLFSSPLICENCDEEIPGDRAL
jgi:hypothetical protein